jgi:hypothetical protein
MRSVRTTLPPRAGRPTRPRVRVTRPMRKLSAAERAAVEERLRSDGILPRTNERI